MTRLVQKTPRPTLRWGTALLAAALALQLFLAPRALSQSGGPYDLTWNTVGGGATSSSGGAYALGSTIGQPSAGVMSGGAYTLTGGFWVGAAAAPYKTFLPLVLK
jgi:hypothetical protein